MVRSAGRYETTGTAGETVNAFVPAPLPPKDPPLAIDGTLSELLRRAEAAVGRLDLAGAMIPSVSWFLYSFVRKEAVVSSQIEGTQASLVDLLMYEAAGRADAVDESDVRQISNYLDALNYARKQIRSKRGLPLSMRLLNEAHRRLLKNVPGAHRGPEKSEGARIGLAEPGPAMQPMCPRHLICWPSCLGRWKNTFTRKTSCTL